MNKKSTKRALLTSMLMLLISCSMFVGSTFAWFTDTVTSGGNLIQSGILDVNLVDVDGNSLEGEVLEFVDLDDNDLWEPGVTYALEDVYVVNDGNLWLQYEITINGIDGDAELLEAIDWTVEVNGTETALEDLKGTLAPGAKTDTIVLVGHMREEAGNEYQGLTADGISITVFATQFTSEYDSFDNMYDDITVVSTAEELKAAVEEGGNVLLANDLDVTDWTANVNRGVTTNLYLNGNTLSATTTVADKNGDGSLNASDNYNVFLVNAGGTLNIYGDGEITVAHTASDMEWNAMTTIAHAYGDVNVYNGAELKNFGGTSMAFALNVYSGGNLDIEDSFLGSTYCAVRAFNAQAGAESVVDVTNSALVSYTHNRAFWAQYDKELTVNGVLSEAEATEAGNTIYGKVLDARSATNPLWIGGVDGEYDTFVTTAAALKDALATGGNIVLAADINVAETTFTLPADKTATLDLNGKTIEGTFNCTSNANKSLIEVKGSLTVVGEGLVTMNTTGNNMGWNAMSCALYVNGGDLTVNNARIENLGGTDMAYAIDTNPWNPASNPVLDVVLNNVTVESTYRGIRVRDNGPYLVKFEATDSTLDEIWYQEYNPNYDVKVEVILHNTTADTSRVNSAVLTID